jgi:SAM-dependent methyltransferase
MRRVPRFVDKFSRALMLGIAGTGFGRATAEKLLRSYYPLAQTHGVGSITVPLWYQWLRAYYFSALRQRLSNQDFQRKYWEFGSLTDYRRYAVDEATDQRVRIFIEQIVVHARRLSQSTERVRIVEIGCGTGLPLQLLRDALGNTSRLSLYGFDISMNGLLLARRSLGPGVSLVQASVTSLPFSRPFHLAFCRGVLMFLDHASVRSAFRELAQSCAVLVLAEPSNVRGETVDSDQLEASIRRDGLDQTSWIHPYRQLALASGARIVSKELVQGNLVLVLEWHTELPASP